jgi:protein-tyrosine-phosphatase
MSQTKTILQVQSLIKKYPVSLQVLEGYFKSFTMSEKARENLTGIIENQIQYYENKIKTDSIEISPRAKDLLFIKVLIKTVGSAAGSNLNSLASDIDRILEEYSNAKRTGKLDLYLSNYKNILRTFLSQHMSNHKEFLEGMSLGKHFGIPEFDLAALKTRITEIPTDLKNAFSSLFKDVGLAKYDKEKGLITIAFGTKQYNISVAYLTGMSDAVKASYVKNYNDIKKSLRELITGENEITIESIESIKKNLDECYNESLKIMSNLNKEINETYKKNITSNNVSNAEYITKFEALNTSLDSLRKFTNDLTKTSNDLTKLLSRFVRGMELRQQKSISRLEVAKRNAYRKALASGKNNASYKSSKKGFFGRQMNAVRAAAIRAERLKSIYGEKAREKLAPITSRFGKTSFASLIAMIRGFSPNQITTLLSGIKLSTLKTSLENLPGVSCRLTHKPLTQAQQVQSQTLLSPQQVRTLQAEEDNAQSQRRFEENRAAHTWIGDPNKKSLEHFKKTVRQERINKKLAQAGPTLGGKAKKSKKSKKSKK